MDCPGTRAQQTVSSDCLGLDEPPILTSFLLKPAVRINTQQ